MSTCAADERADRDHRRAGVGAAPRACPAARGSGRSRRSGSTGRSRSRRRRASAASTSGVGPGVLRRRANSTPSIGPARALDDHELLERRASARARRCTWVRTGSSDIGSTRARDAQRVDHRGVGLGQRRARRAAARVRIRHIARSRSPSRNQVGRPAASSASITCQRVAADAVAALVDRVGEPVGDEVGVGRDVDAVDLHVVAGVGDHRQVLGADHVEQAARQLRAAGAAGEERYATRARSGRPVSLIARVRLVADVDRDQQRRQRLDQARRLERAGVHRPQAGDPADQLGDRCAWRPCGRRRPARPRRVGRRGRRASRASTVCSALTTVTPSGTISCACSAAEPWGTPSSRVALPETAAASGTVASTRIWPGCSAPLRLVRFSDWARNGHGQEDDLGRASRPRRSPARRRAAFETRSRTRAAASSARPASREPITTGLAGARQPQRQAEAQRAGAADDRDRVESGARGAATLARRPARIGCAPMRFEGKVALVTGGAGGIGAATCARLAAEGARVAVATSTARPRASWPPTSAAWPRARRALARLDRRRGRARSSSELGPIDVLVNNAGDRGRAVLHPDAAGGLGPHARGQPARRARGDPRGAARHARARRRARSSTSPRRRAASARSCRPSTRRPRPA